VEGERYGVEPGERRHDDDGYEEKLALVVEERVPVVSFTFGCPAREGIERPADGLRTRTPDRGAVRRTFSCSTGCPGGGARE
jgi:hypothetical protein